MNIGDYVTPLPLWNKTEIHRKLAKSVKILGINKSSNSKSGIMYLVKDLNNSVHEIDSSWFQ